MFRLFSCRFWHLPNKERHQKLQNIWINRLICRFVTLERDLWVSKVPVCVCMLFVFLWINSRYTYSYESSTVDRCSMPMWQCSCVHIEQHKPTTPTGTHKRCYKNICEYCLHYSLQKSMSLRLTVCSNVRTIFHITCMVFPSSANNNNTNQFVYNVHYTCNRTFNEFKCF